jgi:hypothetical protein
LLVELRFVFPDWYLLLLGFRLVFL